jgi:nucleoid-associated protein YgaU
LIGFNSRYVSGTVIRITDEDGVSRSTIVLPAPEEKLIQYTEYRIVDGDEVSALASQYLGSPKLWWKIADANPETINWMTLKPGAVIRIPAQ